MTPSDTRIQSETPTQTRKATNSSPAGHTSRRIKKTHAQPHKRTTQTPSSIGNLKVKRLHPPVSSSRVILPCHPPVSSSRDILSFILPWHPTMSSSHDILSFIPPWHPPLHPPWHPPLHPPWHPPLHPPVSSLHVNKVRNDPPQPEKKCLRDRHLHFERLLQEMFISTTWLRDASVVIGKWDAPDISAA